MKKEKLILGIGILAASLAFWEFGLIRQMMAAWMMFAIVFVPLLGFAFVVALFEEAGERGLAWAESNAGPLIELSRRRLAHVSWPELPHRRPVH